MRKFLVPVVGALLAILLGTGAAVASDDGSETGGSETEPPEPHRLPLIAVTGEEFEEFSDCLREQGVDVPEDLGEIRKRLPRLWLDEDSEEAKQLRAALEECRSLLPDDIGDGHPRVLREIPAERLEGLREHAEEFRDCLREQGVDVEEAEDGPFHRLRFFHDMDDDEAEAFREAVEACGGTLPDHFGDWPAHDARPARWAA